METPLFTILRTVVALAGGLAIGYGFGLVQAAAQRRNERRAQRGQLRSGWAVMPGSGLRVAYLLVMLAVIQVVCPVFFVDGAQWWVSAGVAGGYGAFLFGQLRERRASAR
jgi:hypothetical protein